MYFVGSGEAKQIIDRVNRQETELRQCRTVIAQLEQLVAMHKESDSIFRRTKEMLQREIEALKKENRLLYTIKEKHERLISDSSN